jgi:voltage-gated potassium channel
MKGQHKHLSFREKLHEIIFEADKPTGKGFDIVLIILIILSVVTVMLETVPSILARFKNLFFYLEWIFTIIFTIEYLLRLWIVNKPMKYAKSFYGIVDLVSILPSYLAIFFGGLQSLMVIRALRLLRIFRIFKLANHFRQGVVLAIALRRSLPKISVFLFAILLITMIFGSIMYLIEANSGGGFDSIPRSIYWAVVTLTTVGYGDISPKTDLGQFIAAIVMVLGYAVIAVPTGIVTNELMGTSSKDDDISTQHCQSCSKDGHDANADYCKYCGYSLHNH